MGLFKRAVFQEHYIDFKKLGFEYKKGVQGITGWEQMIFHNKTEYLWITVDMEDRKLYLYNEYGIGGMLWEKEIDIPEDVTNNEEKFIDWLDEQCGD